MALTPELEAQITTPGLIELLLDELNVKKYDPALRDEYGQNPDVIFNNGVYLDMEVTPELAREGELNKTRRHLQNLRKLGGLKVGEPGILHINAAGDSIETIFLKITPA